MSLKMPVLMDLQRTMRTGEIVIIDRNSDNSSSLAIFRKSGNEERDELVLEPFIKQVLGMPALLAAAREWVIGSIQRQDHLKADSDWWFQQWKATADAVTAMTGEHFGQPSEVVTKKPLTRFMVTSYDDDQQQAFTDFVIAEDADAAEARIAELRPYANGFDATSAETLRELLNSLETQTPEEIEGELSNLANQ